MRLIHSTKPTAEVLEFPETELALLRAALEAAEHAASQASEAQLYWGVGGFFIGALLMCLSPFFH